MLLGTLMDLTKFCGDLKQILVHAGQTNSSPGDSNEERTELDDHDEDFKEDSERMQNLGVTYDTYKDKCTKILGTELFDKLCVHCLISPVKCALYPEL